MSFTIAEDARLQQEVRELKKQVRELQKKLNEKESDVLRYLEILERIKELADR